MARMAGQVAGMWWSLRHASLGVKLCTITGPSIGTNCRNRGSLGRRGGRLQRFTSPKPLDIKRRTWILMCLGMRKTHQLEELGDTGVRVKTSINGVAWQNRSHWRESPINGQERHQGIVARNSLSQSERECQVPRCTLDGCSLPAR